MNSYPASEQRISEVERGRICNPHRGAERALASGDRLGNRHHAGSLHGRCRERGTHQPSDYPGFRCMGPFPPASVLPYILAQLTGAFLAAATLFVLFNPYLEAREQEKHVARGSPGSEITACATGSISPAPAPVPSPTLKVHTQSMHTND